MQFWGCCGMGWRAIRVRPEIRHRSPWSETIAGTAPAMSQAASAAIVLAGAAWLTGVALGGLAPPYTGSGPLAVRRWGQLRCWRGSACGPSAGGRKSPLGSLTSKLGISPPSLMAAASRDVRTASRVCPSALRDGPRGRAGRRCSAGSGGFHRF